MLTANITDPIWNFSFPYATGDNEIEMFSNALSILLKEAPEVLESIKGTDPTGLSLVDQSIGKLLPFHGNDLVVSDRSDVPIGKIEPIVAAEINPIDSDTLMNINQYIKQIKPSPTEILKKHCIIMVHPKLYSNLIHDVGKFFSVYPEMDTDTLIERLQVLNECQRVAFSGFVPNRKLLFFKNFVSIPTMNTYSLLQGALTDMPFKGVRISYNPLSYYPFKFLLFNTCKINEITAVLQLCADIAQFDDVDTIMKNRFKIDRVKDIKEQLEMI